MRAGLVKGSVRTASSMGICGATTPADRNTLRPMAGVGAVEAAPSMEGRLSEGKGIEVAWAVGCIATVPWTLLATLV